MTQSPAVATSDVGQVLAQYYLLPVAVLLTVAIVTFGAWIVRQQSNTSQALALLLQDVRPPDGPSLRDLVTDLRVQVAANDRDARIGRRTGS